MTDPLDIPAGAAADDDPDVVAGMERLRVLRESEEYAIEFRSAEASRPLNP